MPVAARLLPLLLGAAAAAPASFTHPGAFISPAQLATIRARVAARAEPTTTFLLTSQASVQGNVSYTPFGPPSDGLVTCGSYDKPNIGCSNQTSMQFPCFCSNFQVATKRLIMRKSTKKPFKELGFCAVWLGEK